MKEGEKGEEWEGEEGVGGERWEGMKEGWRT